MAKFGYFLPCLRPNSSLLSLSTLVNALNQRRYIGRCCHQLSTCVRSRSPTCLSPLISIVTQLGRHLLISKVKRIATSGAQQFYTSSTSARADSGELTEVSYQVLTVQPNYGLLLLMGDINYIIKPDIEVCAILLS